MYMLSKLPDPILCHILSFVPTKTSVACSVLSKRWQLLWTLVPVLDLDEERDMPGQWNRQSLRFLEIVDKVYFFHRDIIPVKIPFKKLRLSLRINESPEFNNYLHKWILPGRFEQLDLSLCYQLLTFPKSSHYSNMVVLKLSQSILGSVESCLFPKLRSLNISAVFFKKEDGGSLENFLSACPVLEELEFYALNDTFRICVPTLTSLVLQCSGSGSGSEFLLETPALEYLSFTHDPTEDSLVATTSLCNLSRADITCLVHTNCYTNYGYGSFVMKLLNNLSCVEFLTLSFEKMGGRDDDFVAPLPGIVDKFDYSCLDDLPVFHNLARLGLRIPSCDCVLLPRLLQKFHNLKHISIHKIFDIDEVEVCWEEPLQVPICLSSTLSSFYFQGFEGFKVEVELVKYIRDNAKVMTNMTLKTSSYFKAFKVRAEATHEVSTYRRDSGADDFHVI